MGFGIAQYEAAINKIDTGLTAITGKLAELPSAVHKAQSHWYLPGPVKTAIAWMAKKLADIAGWLKDKIVELLKGAVAPVMFYKYAYDWEGMRGKANGVQGSVKPSTLAIPRMWEGDAKDDYVKAIALQPDAAGRIATLSDKVSMALSICASAGLAFYVTLGIIIYQFISVMTAAIAALVSGVFSWAGFAGSVADSGVTAAMIWAAVATLAAVLGAQAHQMAAIKGEAVDNSTFPGGHWPKATA